VAAPEHAPPAPARGGLFARMAEVLLHVNEPPTRVAAAFALGAGLGFSPFLGVQIVLGLALALALRLNKIAVTAGLFINLPWIQVPYYWAVTVAAGWAIGTPVPDDLRASFGALLSISPFGGRFWAAIRDLMLPWLLPFALGSTVGGLAVAAVAYFGALAFLERRRKKIGAS
jgi:hypothetical protein